MSATAAEPSSSAAETESSTSGAAEEPSTSAATAEPLRQHLDQAALHIVGRLDRAFKGDRVLMTLFLQLIQTKASPWKPLHLVNRLGSWAEEWGNYFPQDDLDGLLKDVKPERQRALAEIIPPSTEGQCDTSASSTEGQPDALASSIQGQLSASASFTEGQATLQFHPPMVSSTLQVLPLRVNAMLQDLPLRVSVTSQHLLTSHHHHLQGSIGLHAALQGLAEDPPGVPPSSTMVPSSQRKFPELHRVQGSVTSRQGFQRVLYSPWPTL
ncbi:hypothetical protein CHARACLAT_032547 [Characodon lateralis]|uniref:Uncharacterized protein n=1 Tax=Characodon lateralis TaxID=208331 RepID=A0ABU7E626_9TELE|nr:hypothetical protein [Characodon lateralis]